MPALFTVGEFDEIDTAFVWKCSEKVNGSHYVVFKNSTHMTPWDARDENIKAVRDFLNINESGKIAFMRNMWRTWIKVE